MNSPAFFMPDNFLFTAREGWKGFSPVRLAQGRSEAEPRTARPRQACCSEAEARLPGSRPKNAFKSPNPLYLRGF